MAYIADEWKSPHPPFIGHFSSDIFYEWSREAERAIKVGTFDEYPWRVQSLILTPAALEDHSCKGILGQRTEDIKQHSSHQHKGHVSSFVCIVPAADLKEKHLMQNVTLWLTRASWWFISSLYTNLMQHSTRNSRNWNSYNTTSVKDCVTLICKDDKDQHHTYTYPRAPSGIAEAFRQASSTLVPGSCSTSVNGASWKSSCSSWSVMASKASILLLYRACVHLKEKQYKDQTFQSLLHFWPIFSLFL